MLGGTWHNVELQILLFTFACSCLSLGVPVPVLSLSRRCWEFFASQKCARTPTQCREQAILCCKRGRLTNNSGILKIKDVGIYLLQEGKSVFKSNYIHQWSNFALDFLIHGSSSFFHPD